MKRLKNLFLMLLVVIATQANGRTIHWLTFIDTTDEWYDELGRKQGVGEADKNSREILYSRWINSVNASLKEYGYNANVIDIYDTNLSPEKCTEIVKNLHCESEDIVVFYYIGHGTENSGTSEFPLCIMGVKLNTPELVKKNINRLVPLSWIHETLVNKHARLTITIGMCCNARQGVPGRIAPSFSLNYGNSYVNTAMDESIKKLFLEYTGDLIVTSSKPGESSYGCMSPLGPTDYFTYNLIDQFNCVLPTQSNPDWEKMFSDVRDAVQSAVEDDESLQSDFPGATQTPFWKKKNKLVRTSRIDKTKIQPPVPPETDEKTEMKTELNKVLAYIATSNVEMAKRKAMANKLMGVFASDLIVRIVSQDGDVVVDKEPIGTFLKRIATDTGILMNVSIADLSINSNGQINMLRVREVYKKKSSF